LSTQRVRVWVAGLTIGGAVNKAQNSTVSAYFVRAFRNFGPFSGSVSIFLLSSFRYFCVRTPPENACSVFANMICYRQSRNILLNRIGHGAFGYSLRFSHFYGDAILNYLLEFFFA